MSPFLIVLCPARNKYRTRKGIQFWVESLIINSAEELCFWRSQFQYYLGSFYIFWILTLYQIHDSQIFLPFSRLSFHFVDAFLWCAETLFLFLFPLPEETYPKKYCQDWCQKVYCLFSSFFCIFFFDHEACGILVSQPGIEPKYPTVDAQSQPLWEVPMYYVLPVFSREFYGLPFYIQGFSPFWVNFLYDVRLGSSFNLLHMAVQFFQHHLLKRLSFFPCMFLAPLS